MISADLLALARCPDCGSRLTGRPPEVACEGCGRQVRGADGYLDLRPAEAFCEQTKYVDEALHADARHETVSPPLLSAGLRNDMLRRFLDPRPSDRLIDLGCGSGRMLLWNRDRGGVQVGLDAAPFFAEEARASVDLALGDLRRLPFADAAFTKAYALDVFEHLSRDGLTAVLAETARVLEPGGALFVYSHVRRNAPLAVGLRAINRAARGLERIGAIDLTQERLRKSDHLNPLADIDDLERTVSAAGFRIARIRYYTPLVGGLVENIFVRIAERWLGRRARASREPGATGDGGARAARTEAKRRIAAGGWTYRILRLLTWCMKIDVVLFGRVKSGPFFALLVKQAADGGPRTADTGPVGRL